MRTHGEMTLENHKLFPIVAWGLFFGFAFFTWNLAMQLQSTTEAASARAQQLEAMVNDNSSRLDAIEATIAETE